MPEEKSLQDLTVREFRELLNDMLRNPDNHATLDRWIDDRCEQKLDKPVGIYALCLDPEKRRIFTELSHTGTVEGVESGRIYILDTYGEEPRNRKVLIMEILDEFQSAMTSYANR